MVDLSIIPECYIDTNLIETIVPTAKGYNHQKGAGTVAKLMQGKLNDKFAVGISLQDYRLPTNLKELTKITKKVTSKNNPVFKKLFREFKRRNPKNVKILSEWIKYLKENQYNVDIKKTPPIHIR